MRELRSVCTPMTRRGSQALRPGRADVVRPDVLHHARPRQPGGDGEAGSAQHEAGNDQAQPRIVRLVAGREEPLGNHVGDARIRAQRVAELHADELADDDAEHEDRDRDDERRRDLDEVVDESATAQAREDAGDDADDRLEDERDDGEANGVRQSASAMMSVTSRCPTRLMPKSHWAMLAMRSPKRPMHGLPVWVRQGSSRLRRSESASSMAGVGVRSPNSARTGLPVSWMPIDVR